MYRGDYAFYFYGTVSDFISGARPNFLLRREIPAIKREVYFSTDKHWVSKIYEIYKILVLIIFNLLTLIFCSVLNKMTTSNADFT